MGKRKLFEKIDQTLPVTGAERSSKGVIQFPLATIPPTATSVPIGRIAGGQRNFDFKDFYGHGVDEVAFALQRQIERFVAGEEKNLANASVLTICRCGVTPFLDYMIARSTAEQRDFTLGDINRNLIDGFLGWLRHGDTKLGSQRSCYSSFKSVLFSLGKRGLITVVDEGDDRTFPKNPFPGAFRSHKGAKPLPKGQRQAFAKALRKTVLPLFHSDALLNTYLLTAALLLVALHTGRNATPLLEMRTDCLRAHPKAGRLFLVLFKRRGYTTHKVALRNTSRTDDDSKDIELTPTVRPSVAQLIQRIIALGEPLRAEGPDHIRERVWLYRCTSNRGRDSIRELKPKAIDDSIKKLVAAHGLKDSEGKPLQINISRLRKTFVNRIFEILDGDIVTTAVAAGHAGSQTTGRNYLRPNEQAVKNWKFMGNVLTEELLSGSIEQTPLAHCSAPRSGQYAPKRDGETCSNYLNCLRCRNYVVTGDDLYKLFSFGMRILKERNRIAKQKWKKHFAHIPRLIERDVIQQGIEQKKFKPDDVDAARERAKHDPHPFWLTDSLVADLEALG